jgi:hypothetical protein
MPLLNYARSYKPLAIQVKRLVNDTKCIYSFGLNRSQIAGLSFHGDLKFNDLKTNLSQVECVWLISNPETLAQPSTVIDNEIWEKYKVIRRPADKREDIVIFKKITPNANE